MRSWGHSCAQQSLRCSVSQGSAPATWNLPLSPWSKAIPGPHGWSTQSLHAPPLLNHILGSHDPGISCLNRHEYASGPVWVSFLSLTLEERLCNKCVYSWPERWLRGICFCRVRTSLTTGLAIHTQAQNHFNPGWSHRWKPLYFCHIRYFNQDSDIPSQSQGPFHKQVEGTVQACVEGSRILGPS